MLTRGPTGPPPPTHRRNGETQRIPGASSYQPSSRRRGLTRRDSCIPRRSPPGPGADGVGREPVQTHCLIGVFRWAYPVSPTTPTAPQRNLTPPGLAVDLGLGWPSRVPPPHPSPQRRYPALPHRPQLPAFPPPGTGLTWRDDCPRESPPGPGSAAVGCQGKPPPDRRISAGSPCFSDGLPPPPAQPPPAGVGRWSRHRLSGGVDGVGSEPGGDSRRDVGGSAGDGREIDRG